MSFGEWRRYWLLVDLLALAGGAALGIWYYVSSARRGQGPAALDSLWVNGATELLGVWVSVRIIDAIVRKRDRHSALRQDVLSEARYIVDRAEAILAGDGDAIEQLLEAVTEADRPSTEKQRALTPRERRLLEAAMQPARRLWNLGLDLHKLDARAARQFEELSPTVLTEIRQELPFGMASRWENVFVLRQLVENARKAAIPGSDEVVNTLRQLVSVAAEYKRTLAEMRHWERPLRHMLAVG